MAAGSTAGASAAARLVRTPPLRGDRRLPPAFTAQLSELHSTPALPCLPQPLQPPIRAKCRWNRAGPPPPRGRCVLLRAVNAAAGCSTNTVAFEGSPACIALWLLFPRVLSLQGKSASAGPAQGPCPRPWEVSPEETWAAQVGRHRCGWPFPNGMHGRHEQHVHQESHWILCTITQLSMHDACRAGRHGWRGGRRRCHG